MQTVQPYNWVDKGGVFWIVAGVCLISTGVSIWQAMRLGSKHSSEGEGCLMAMLSPILALGGGALGFFSSQGQYPLLIFTTTLGSVVIPALGLLIFARRIRSQR